MPVSSSAHLAMLPRLAGWDWERLDPELRKSFEVALHAGAAMALLFARRDEIRGELTAAWDEFTQQDGEPAPTEAFTAFLASAPEHADAFADVDAIQALFGQIHTMGVTRREMAACKRNVLRYIIPSGLDQETFEQAIGVDGIG